MVPIAGTVTIDGKPLSTGTIVTTVEQGEGARGVLNENGEFQLETPGVGPGAIPGKHYVAVVAYEAVEPGNLESERRALVPNKYLSAYGSGLIIDVHEGREKPANINLSNQ